MTRWKAAGLHLLVSMGAAALAASLIFFVWYPRPYFTITGGSSLMPLIIGVNLAIGPLLTLAVFRSGKKGLLFDLTAIAALQTMAFCYGMYVTAAARPVFVVAEIDRFVVVAANALDDEDLAAGSEPEYRTRSWFGPRLVGAMPPQTGQEALDVAISGMHGKDIERFPKYYVPFARVADVLLGHSHGLADLHAKSAQDERTVQAFLATQRGDWNDYRSLPVQGHKEFYTMIVDARTAQPLTVLPIDPW